MIRIARGYITLEGIALDGGAGRAGVSAVTGNGAVYVSVSQHHMRIACGS